MNSKEIHNLKSNESMRKFRAAVKAVKPATTKKRLPDTPEVIKSRARIKAWEESHKDKVAQNQRNQALKRTVKSKSRIADAIAQAEATQRNVDNITHAEMEA